MFGGSGDGVSTTSQEKLLSSSDKLADELDDLADELDVLVAAAGLFFMGDLAGDADLERLCLFLFMGDLANDAVVFIGDCSASIIT